MCLHQASIQREAQAEQLRAHCSGSTQLVSLHHCLQLLSRFAYCTDHRAGFCTQPCCCMHLSKQSTVYSSCQWHHASATPSRESKSASAGEHLQQTAETTKCRCPAVPCRLPDAAVFADAGGRLLLWPYSSGGRNSKYTVLIESCGSKVVCLAAAPDREQQQQQVGP